jgi:hypothetical protein
MSATQWIPRRNVARMIVIRNAVTVLRNRTWKRQQTVMTTTVSETCVLANELLSGLIGGSYRRDAKT